MSSPLRVFSDVSPEGCSPEGCFPEGLSSAVEGVQGGCPRECGSGPHTLPINSLSLCGMHAMKFFLLAIIAVSSRALELVPSNWEAQTQGKTVFLKFFAPWCGHCKRMKPDWDTLMKEYEDHPSILIADVDCIGSGESICRDQGVQGFPTIKYGDPSNLQDYTGARDLMSIQSHAAQLTPACTFDNEEHCTTAQLTEMTHIRGMGRIAIVDKVANLVAAQESAEVEFKEGVAALQQAYETLVSDKEKQLQDIKDQHLGLYQLALKLREDDKDEL